MKGYLSVDGLVLGEIELNVIDRSMTVIGGMLQPNENYDQYRERFFHCFDAGRCAGLQEFDFVFTLSDGTRCEPIGGIALWHGRQFPDEIEVDIAGVGPDVVRRVDTMW